MKLLKIFQDKSLLLFTVLCLSIFSKCVLFHYLCFDYIAVRSIITDTSDFFAFYFSKLLPAIIISSFVFVTKRYGWTVIVSVIIDLWFISNVIYNRCTGLFIDYQSLLLVQNMDGFWSSVSTYFSGNLLYFLLLSLIYFLFIRNFEKQEFKKNKRHFIISFIVCFLLVFYDFAFGYGRENKYYKRNIIQVIYNTYNPDAFPTSSNKTFIIVERGSGLHSVVSMLVYAVHDAFFTPHVNITKSEEKLLNELCFSEYKKNKMDQNLIVFVVESLESWAISYKDSCDNLVAPTLFDLCKNGSGLFCTKVRSQAKAGISGDGQMIINTGMLPISDGAACMLYGNNVYPNYAHFYNRSVVVDGCGNFVWNQPVVTYSYGYRNIEPSGGEKMATRDDAIVMNYASSVLDTILSPFCLEVITVTTHSPWDDVEEILPLPLNMPKDFKKYLNSLHYADSCLGVLLSRIDRDSLLEKTTIVITGDHTVFKSGMLKEYSSFSASTGSFIPEVESFCPLIIFSPNIDKHIEITDLCYQMDIYPTILHCIGADNYYWKGFGVNLLDTIARHNRKITEEDAYILSDKLIRSNYFSKLAF